MQLYSALHPIDACCVFISSKIKTQSNLNFEELLSIQNFGLGLVNCTMIISVIKGQEAN